MLNKKVQYFVRVELQFNYISQINLVIGFALHTISIQSLHIVNKHSLLMANIQSSHTVKTVYKA